MHKNQVLSVTPLANHKLFVIFKDASERVYDVRPLFDEIPSFKQLRDDAELFYRVKPEMHGNAVIWNDDLDLASDELFLNGERIPHIEAIDSYRKQSLSRDEILTFPKSDVALRADLAALSDESSDTVESLD